MQILFLRITLFSTAFRGKGEGADGMRVSWLSPSEKSSVSHNGLQPVSDETNCIFFHMAFFLKSIV